MGQKFMKSDAKRVISLPDNAKAWAEEIGPSESDNYLAHTIKLLERRIFKIQNKPYLILTQKYTERQGSWLEEYPSARLISMERNHCTIFFPPGKEYGDKHARLFIAHELGHIAYHITHEGSMDGLKSSSEERDETEELFAWEFAFHLLSEKSAYYEKVQNEKVQNENNPYIIKDSDLVSNIKNFMAELHKDSNELIEKLERKLDQ